MKEPDLNELLKQQQALEDQLMAKFDRGTDIFHKYELNKLMAEAYLDRPKEGTLGADMAASLLRKLDVVVAGMTQDELKDYFVAIILKDFMTTCKDLFEIEEELAKEMEK